MTQSFIIYVQRGIGNTLVRKNGDVARFTTRKEAEGYMSTFEYRYGAAPYGVVNTGESDPSTAKIHNADQRAGAFPHS